jgi:multimeric flavodoxin WrbA
MKIITLSGSRRKNGNTARSLQLLHEALKKEAEKNNMTLEWKQIALSSMDIRPCRGCRLCFDKGEEACPLHDDLLAVHRMIKDSDCIVLASPVYVNDVSGTMKTLIDRLAFVCHRPQYHDSPFFLLATTGGSPCRHTIRTMQSAAVSWAAPLAGRIALIGGALSEKEALAAVYGNKIAKAARRIVRFVSRRRYKKPSFLSLLVFAVQQYTWKRVFESEGYDSADARFWMEQRLFEKTYLFNHRSFPLKTAAARVAGKIIGRIFN